MRTDTLFGCPVIPCDNPEPHDWHGDGVTYCLGDGQGGDR